MSHELNRIDMSSLRKGLPGWTPESGISEYVNDAYYVGDYTYFIKRFNKNSGFRFICIAWIVTKCASDGMCIEEYEVTFKNKRIECSCRAGSKHYACRHKEFVLDAERQRVKRRKANEIASIK